MAGLDEQNEGNTLEVLVGRVGKAHGLRGEVTVQTTTDSPERRFAPGSQLRSGEGRRLVVDGLRLQSGTWVIAFAQVSDRSAAEALRGTELWADIPTDESDADPDEFHDTALVGLVVVSPQGDHLGSVARVLHLPAQDALVVRTTRGERLVPFVTELVPEVDLTAGRVVVDPIPGLFDEEGQIDAS